jgi:hypothetical protein
MKRRCRFTELWKFVFWVGLIALMAVPFIRNTAAAEPVTLTVYDPTGAIEVSQLFAPRLANLNGKTICQISDNLWETDRTFPLIGQLLQRQFPTMKMVSYKNLPEASTDVNPKLIAAVKAAGCQAVIVGNAG